MSYGYMDEWKFVKAIDKTDNLSDFSLNNDIAIISHSLEFKGTNGEINLMINDTASRNSGTGYMWVYTSSLPPSGDSFRVGPCARILEDASYYGYGIAAVLLRENSGMTFQLISLNSDSTSVTVDDSDSTITLADNEWYLIEMNFSESAPNVTFTCKIYDTYGGSQIGSTLTNTYNDTATRGSMFGAFFQRTDVPCYAEKISLLW
jgi:hypothetical protein